MSVYSFWGLLGFYLFAMAAMSMQFTIPADMRLAGRTSSAPDTAHAMLALGAIAGFLVGWLVTRHKSLLFLAILGATQALCGLAIGLLDPEAMLPLAASFFLLGLASAAILLAVPAIFAGGRGGAETFAILFGLAIFLNQSVATTITSVLWDTIAIGRGLNPAASALAYSLAILAALGLLFLLPVNPSLFNGAPPERRIALKPKHRHPVAVAFLCLIPFYGFYWLYRAHGEAIEAVDPAQIPAPWAAVLAALLLPIVTPILLVKLFEARNEARQAHDQPPVVDMWVMYILAILLFPVAAAVVQATINSTIRAQAGEPSNAR
ncbi:hypothetical protein CAI21_18770 [Alkalilimnicola ehrlichii]|uniref:Uncharacterized protein n=1 Tax=Alkalilimnicola ehrlichii TaxID=351052 RepID=A0A3E0WL40_9GAMM|nr:hypothetical protein [Alkalilimnicola ehrlichii]RFA25570.1 hypothetical protein CAI21_18770 [Alkalilimnicola ehrlichii]RFA32696.1 hypothetical protein CAL65_19020 [Alkalilimnicola ehrlichii]